jgi:hypothetical protein
MFHTARTAGVLFDAELASGTVSTESASSETLAGLHRNVLGDRSRTELSGRDASPRGPRGLPDRARERLRAVVQPRRCCELAAARQARHDVVDRYAAHGDDFLAAADRSR